MHAVDFIAPIKPAASLWVRRRGRLALFLAALFLLPLSGFAALPRLSGDYATPVKSGKFRFTPVKRVIQFGYQGNCVISGKLQPGVLYTVRGTTNIALAWYYGVTGVAAGSAMLAPQGDGSYTGTIEFTDRKGNVTSSGSITLK